MSTATSDPPAGGSPAGQHDDVIPDWVDVVHRDPDVLRAVMRPSFQKVYSPSGYSRAEKDSLGATLAWGHAANGGSMLSLPGETLAARRALGMDSDLALTRYFVKQRAKANRFDLARDTSAGVGPHYLATARRNGRIVSHLGFGQHGFEDEANFSFNVGSSRSLFQLRTYNKKAQLEEQGIDIPLPALNRLEIVLRRHVADAVMHEVASVPEETDRDTGEVTWPLLGIFNRELGRRIRVTARRADKKNNNQSRAKTDPAWEAFLAVQRPDLKTLDAREGRPESDFVSYVTWVRTIAPGLRMIRELVGEEGLQRLLTLGRGQLKPSVQRMLETDPDLARSIVLNILGLKAEGEDEL